MGELKEYKCPACGGAVRFDSHTQKMKCPYCDTEFDVETIKEYDEQLEKDKEKEDDFSGWQTNAGSQWQEGEKDTICVYTCQSCGGEIIADENTGASVCPFCGNPVIIKDRFEGGLKPDCVVPFKLDKKQAKSAYYQYIKGKPLLPRVFKNENHIDSIKGIYVPFWLFDGDVDADIRYRATRVRVWSDSQYDYTQTSYYSLERRGNMSFSAVPVDGSEKMADDLMESIEPFHMEEAVDFETAYLSGYLADKYDVDEKQSEQRARTRMKVSAEEVLGNTVVGYASSVPESSCIHVTGGMAQYALYPVWILNTTWKGKSYLFAMNGQTGKMTGNLPVDNGLYARWLLGLTGIFSAISFLILFLCSLAGI
ncbi:MAG: hypothetical protein SO401_04165 [Blautia sp.]|nr:hypothetical protein [Blautia sp.]